MKLIYALMFILLIPVAFAYNLQDYPDLFINENLNVKIVVGDLAIASDTIGAIEIATSLQVDYHANRTYEPPVAVLASDIEDVSKENLIVVGGPCANAVAAELMNYPQPCYASIPSNTGIIEMYEYSGGTSVLVAGSSAMDTRRASRVLANHDDFNIPASDSMEIFAASGTEISIN